MTAFTESEKMHTLKKQSFAVLPISEFHEDNGVRREANIYTRTYHVRTLPGCSNKYGNFICQNIAYGLLYS